MHVFQKIANRQNKIFIAALFKITKETNNLETECPTIKDYLNIYNTSIHSKTMPLFLK